MRQLLRCGPEHGAADDQSRRPAPGIDLCRLLGSDVGRTGSLLCPAHSGLRGRAVSTLQRAVGNSSVQRLLTPGADASLPVQRYAVAARPTASCEQVVDWLNTKNPHRPAWAKTTPRFGWTGSVVVTGGGPDFTVSVSRPQVTLRMTVDMPQWSPTDAAMGSAWRGMYATLRAHEAEHEAIAARWKDILRHRLATPSQTVHDGTRAAAQQATQAAVQAEWRGWLAEHQSVQNAIDPFTAVLDCPAPTGEQGSP